MRARAAIGVAAGPLGGDRVEIFSRSLTVSGRCLTIRRGSIEVTMRSKSKSDTSGNSSNRSVFWAAVVEEGADPIERLDSSAGMDDG